MHDKEVSPPSQVLFFISMIVSISIYLGQANKEQNIVVKYDQDFQVMQL